MAINLKKENSGDEERKIRTVYPENNAEEIYPQREIYPENNVAEEIYPEQKQPSKVKEAFSEFFGYEEAPQQNNIPEVRPPVQTQYPAAPVNTPPDAKVKKKRVLAMLLGGLMVCMIIGGIVITARITDNISVEPEPDSTIVAVPGNYDGGTGMESAEFSPSEVNEIIIRDAFSDINITENYSGKITTETENYSGEDYDVSLENNILTISRSGSYEEDSGEVNLYIPAAYRGPITVEAEGESDIYCSAGKNLKITVDSGYVSLNDINGTDVEVTANSAGIYLDSCELNSCTLHTYDGYLNVGRSVLSERCVLYTGNGGITFDSSVFLAGADAKTDNGYIDIASTSISGASSLTAANSYIQGYDFNFEDLDISCRNGSVDIETEGAAGDYTVTSSNTVNSTVEYIPQPPSSGEHKISLDLLNTNAEIRFNENS